MTTLIAWRNLVHDPVRFAATLIGIIFSVVLMAIQAGMLMGFADTTTGLVRHSSADIWLVPRGTTNVDQSAILPQRTYFQALKTDGVAQVSRHIVRFVSWRRPQGGSQLVIVVGFDPAVGLAGPWNVVEGSVAALSAPNTVMIDRLYAAKLGVSAIGDTVEIAGRRADRSPASRKACAPSPRHPTSSPATTTRCATPTCWMAMPATCWCGPSSARRSPPLVARLQAAAPNTDVMTTEAFAAKTPELLDLHHRRRLGADPRRDARARSSAS